MKRSILSVFTLCVLDSHSNLLKTVYVCGHIAFRDSSISYNVSGSFKVTDKE